MPIDAGELNRRVRLERRVVEVDSSRQAKTNWKVIATVSAKVDAVTAGERFAGRQFVATGDLQFTIRVRKDLTPLDRVVYDGRAYDVASVVPKELDALVIVGTTRTDTKDVPA